MNADPTYSERMQDFLSAWQNETNEAFNLVKSAVHNLEESFHSASSHNSSIDPIAALRSSNEFGSLNSETCENPSLSTSYDSHENSFKFNLSPSTMLRTSDQGTTQRRPKPSELKTRRDTSLKTTQIDESDESPLSQLRRSSTCKSLKPLFVDVYEKIVALAESKTSVLDSEPTPSHHSPMLKPKIYETNELFFNIKESPPEEENKEVHVPEKERALIHSFDLDTKLGLFSKDFIEKVLEIEKEADSLREVYQRIIEHIFCTKNIISSKAYPRTEIIYSSQVDSKKFLLALQKVAESLRAEEFEIKKNFNDDINFLEAKLELFARRMGATSNNFKFFKSKIKIDEVEFRRLHERVYRVIKTYSVSDKTKRAIRNFIILLQEQLRLFPTYLPVNDKIPEKKEVNIEYVTVRKLLEKLIECHETFQTANAVQTVVGKTLLADKLMQTVVFTYDHFISATSFLIYLIQKYYTPHPFMMSYSEYCHMKAHQISTTKLRILDIIKYWVEERSGDFERDPTLLSLLVTFIESIHQIAKESSSQAEFQNTWEKVKSIINSILHEKKEQKFEEITKRIQEEERINRTNNPGDLQRVGSLTKLRTLSPSLFPKERLAERYLSKNSHFGGKNESHNKIPLIPDDHILSLWDPRDIAKQLTIIDHEMFCDIDLFEMLIKRWNDTSSSKDCPNIKAAINRFNTVSFWVQYIILNQRNEDDRYHLLHKFIAIACCCLEYRNYNSAHMIYSGILPLYTNGIWKGTIAANQGFAKLQKIFDSETFTQDMDKEYRNSKEPTVPSIPYFTKVFFRLQDNINFFAKFEGNEKYLKHHHLSQIAEACKLMRQFQKTPYEFRKSLKTLYPYLKHDYKDKAEVDLESSEIDEILRAKLILVKKNLELAAFL